MQSLRYYFRKLITRIYVKYVLLPEAKAILNGEPGSVEMVIKQDIPVHHSDWIH